jgi:hypothetical protein
MPAQGEFVMRSASSLTLGQGQPFVESFSAGPLPGPGLADERARAHLHATRVEVDGQKGALPLIEHQLGRHREQR